MPYSRFHGWVRPCFQGAEVVERYGLKLELNAGENQDFFHYFLGRRPDEELEELARMCRDASVIADVGANKGLVSLFLAARRPDAKIYSFEPDPRIAEAYERNVRRNPGVSAGLELCRFAASDRDGTLFFASSAGTPNEGTGRVLRGGESGIRVEARRLDDFFFSKGRLPDVVKMDVEGAEYDALRGMKRLFEAGYPKKMLVEVHGFYFPEGPERLRFNRSVRDVLVEGGFRLSILYGKPGLEDLPEQWPSRLHLLAERKTP
jgi:FkbM family methyltransferase